jgi:Protein of unknown function (DUF3617)
MLRNETSAFINVRDLGRSSRDRQAQQRARLEERMRANSDASTNTSTDKHCVTKEDVEKADFGQGKGECTYTIETSTSTHAKGSYSCNVEGMK